MFVFKDIWAATWRNQQFGCAPSEDSDQPGHPPSLIRVFAVRMKKAWVVSYPFSAKRRLWSDWADAQADLSLRWAHIHFVGFVMSRLIFLFGPCGWLLRRDCVHRYFTLFHDCIVGVAGTDRSSSSRKHHHLDKNETRTPQKNDEVLFFQKIVSLSRLLYKYKPSQKPWLIISN